MKESNGVPNGAKPSTLQSTHPKTTKISWGAALRWMLVDIPLVLVFAAFLLSLIFQDSYHNYVKTIIDAWRHGDLEGDLQLFSAYDNDFTYYNRQCDASDITTDTANDLVIQNDFTGDEAADVMMEHGAVLFKDVLRNTTSTQLRKYLATRHELFRHGQLPYMENFWDDIGRLALGLGVDDSPIVAQALQEVGSHRVLKESLESILGPDPAVVEISTMTSLHGADFQNIHTDSDWFGSSLLYARTFFHSYTLFIALQDTPQAMGATTVCPGSHYCANPDDMGDYCLDSDLAFEVSSNGHDGADGAVLQGDALLFNQNIWHRGSQNLDASQKDRVMFIVTFLSRKDYERGDRRQQGLGTYYYMRFNTWGHTFNDLKQAATSMMQPFAWLRSWGLWKPSHTHWGWPWIFHFCQQVGNGDHFYDPYELRKLVEVLDRWGVPDFLKGTSRHGWEAFIEDSMAKWVAFLGKVNAAVVGVYLVLRVLVWLILKLVRKSSGSLTRKSSYIPLALKRLVLTHVGVALLAYGLVRYIEHTDLAQLAKTGDIYIRPFPEVTRTSDAALTMGPSTYPERSDVLIGTRFDANFLGAFDRFLDFHPGNMKWRSLLVDHAEVPPVLQEDAARAIVETLTVHDTDRGVPSRFLLQNPYNGKWMLLSQAEAVERTRQALVMEKKDLLKALKKQVDIVLADARFGVARDTAMARQFGPLFAKTWVPLLFPPPPKEDDDIVTVSPVCCRPKKEDGPAKKIVKSSPSPDSGLALKPLTGSKSRFNLEEHQAYLAERSIQHKVVASSVPNVIRRGDRVLGKWRNGGLWLEAEVIHVYSDGKRCAVQYLFERPEVLSIERIRKYEPLTEGDVVQVLTANRGPRKATIGSMHPDSSYNIVYADGSEEFGLVGRDNIRKPAIAVTTSLVLEKGPEEEDEGAIKYRRRQRILGNFENKGEMFDGQILKVNSDGTYDLLYDDGDQEKGVPSGRILPVDL